LQVQAPPPAWLIFVIVMESSGGTTLYKYTFPNNFKSQVLEPETE